MGRERGESIIEYAMPRSGERVVVAVSGGADSVYLLLALSKRQKSVPFSLIAAHIEHGIRGEESEKDAEFVSRLCRREGILLHTFYVDVSARAARRGESQEQAARFLRYGCLMQLCREYGCCKIATAHQRDDSAETVLLNLCRGSGVRGLRGILPISETEEYKWGECLPYLIRRTCQSPPGCKGASRKSDEEKAPSEDERISIIRPLLEMSKEEICKSLEGRGQSFRSDESNDMPIYARNRIRLQVMPVLDGINGKTAQHLVRLGRDMREICEYLDEAARAAMGDGVGLIYTGKNGERVRYPLECAGGAGERASLCGALICRQDFVRMHPTLKRHLISYILSLLKQGGRECGAKHIKAVCDLFDKPAGKMTDLPGGMVARGEREAVSIIRAARNAYDALQSEEYPGEASVDLVLTVPGYCEPGGGMRIFAELRGFDGNFDRIPRNMYTKWFDYDKIKNTVHIRNRKPGDFIQVNAKGGRKKIKDYLIDEKVPREERGRVLLLADGKHVIWAVGHRISEAYKIGADTRRVLIVRAEMIAEKEAQI